MNAKVKRTPNKTEVKSLFDMDIAKMNRVECDTLKNLLKIRIDEIKNLPPSPSNLADYMDYSAKMRKVGARQIEIMRGVK